MTRDEVVDYRQSRSPASVPLSPVLKPSDRQPLSRREMEVAELVADGATNAQVAARLFISERTVESHLASIFNKLGVDYASPGRAMVREHRRGLRRPEPSRLPAHIGRHRHGCPVSPRFRGLSGTKQEWLIYARLGLRRWL